MRNVRIATGQHTLHFRLANHADGQLQVDVRRRRETFRITLSPMGTIAIDAANDTANSAAVRIDGQPLGNIPYRGTVAPGRHLVQVGREGYVTFSQCVELTGGQVLTLPVMLEREAPNTGSILVAGDVPGAPIFVDGAQAGTTPAVLENITPGSHTVEVRPDGMQPSRDTVVVTAGQRASVSPTFRRAATGTPLRVLANVPTAVISIDGNPQGNPPVTIEVAPGEHIVEGTADGYENAEERIMVEPGNQRIVSLELRPRERAAGRIIVNSSVPGAEVTVDGENRGTPPVVVDTPNAGTHAIVVQANGYQDFRETCTTAPGRDCEIEARLAPIGTPVRVSAGEARDAELYVDGSLVGPVPYEGTLPVGSHRIEIRAEGYDTYEQTILLEAQAQARDFNIAMHRVGDLSEADREAQAEAERQRREGAMSHAAAPLPANVALMDVSVGWPYVAEIRLGVGMLDFLDGGFAMRTFGRLTEFELRAKFGWQVLPQLSVALQIRGGGGLGPSRDPTAEEVAADPDTPDHSLNTWFAAFELMGTLSFSNQGAFTLWTSVESYTDGYDWDGEDSDNLNGIDGRQNQSRLHLGGALELAMSAHWNLWGILDGILVGPDRSRNILGDIFGFGAEDTELYFRLGLTYKF